jgi:CspA family cold shock protein
MDGTIKWYNRMKGYGFIIGEDDAEFFFHHSFLDEGLELTDNDKVTFDPIDTEKGKQAKNIKKVE